MSQLLELILVMILAIKPSRNRFEASSLERPNVIHEPKPNGYQGEYLDTGWNTTKVMPPFWPSWPFRRFDLFRSLRHKVFALLTLLMVLN